MLANSLMLLSEYDTCREYLPKDKVENSKKDIMSKLKQIIIKIWMNQYKLRRCI